MTPHARVLMIVENLPVPFDRRVWMEATALRDQGYDVTVICPTGKGHDTPHERLDGVEIFRHPLPTETDSKFSYFREYAAALYHEFRLARKAQGGRPFDVVHICNPPDLLFLVAAWLKLFHGTKVVFDHHDASPEMYEAKFGRRDFFYHGLKLAERLTFATADVVISTNQSYRDVAIRRGRKKPSDVFVVRSAPDLSQFKRTVADPKYKAGARYLVGYVGIMADQDGVDNLLKAAHHVVKVKGRTDVRFMLIGGGPSLTALQELTRELGLEDQVEFAGYQSGDELLRRLSTCDVCASPDHSSAYSEMCTMNKIIEYMALSKPLVQFDLREGRVSAGDASLYATDVEDFGNKIIELVDDPEKRRTMGAAGRARTEGELEWRHQVPHLLHAYERVTAMSRLIPARRKLAGEGTTQGEV